MLPFLLFCNHLANEEKAGCFTCIVSLMSCGCYCSLPLPRGAVGGLQCLIVAFPGFTYFLLGLESHKQEKKPPKLVYREIE